MGNSKIIYNGEVKIDLTSDTVAEETLAKGVTAHDKSGNQITGTLEIPSTKNLQAYSGTATVRATAYTATAVSLTVAKTGTYTVSWMGWRNTNGGTSGSQLYIGNSAYGSANTTFTNTYGHAVKLTNVSLTKDQVITVRARARSASYYMVVGNLIIQEN